MVYQLSPGVLVNEIDLTTIVPAVGTTDGAFAGDFAWGPANTIVTLSNEDELVSTFGRPNDDTFTSFFTCANFLSYARSLKVVRAAGSTANNATASGVGVRVENRDDYELNHRLVSNTHGMFAARYLGELGNSLKVSLWAGSNSTQFNSWTYAGQFDSAPGTSLYASRGNGANDEMHIIVVDEDGKFSNGERNTVLERFAFLSKASDAKTPDGSSNYYVNAINDRSRYIYIMSHALANSANISAVGVTSNGSNYTAGFVTFQGGSGTGANASVAVDGNGGITTITINNKGTGYVLTDSVTANVAHLNTDLANSSIASLTVNLQLEPETANWGRTANGTTFSQNSASYTMSLSGGSYATPSDGTIMSGYDKFKNQDEVDISLVLTGAHSQTVAEYVIDNIVGGTADAPDTGRKDSIAFISPRRTDVVNQVGEEADNCVEYRNLFPSSSYAVMDCNWKYQYDKYNDVYRWVPLNGDIAGLCVRTDFERDPWFSPAGFNRGSIKNVTKLAWNPDKTDRDTLYKSNINPVVSFPGEGVILFGDKTMQTKPSAFDRINVRRLFLVLEKAIARAAKYSLFEFNDEFTRAQFVALVEPFLRDVQGRRGIYDFRVVCDTTNNTPEVIDRNEFIGDIYIKPARSINFIKLNFIAVRTGVAFEEVVGKF